MTPAEQLDQLVSRVADLQPAQAVREAREFFRALPPETARGLADDKPDQVGALDGAPAQLRYRANHLRLVAARDRLRSAAQAGTANRRQRARLRTVEEMLTPAKAAGVDESGRVVELERNRQFLSVNADGQGRVVEVVGDLDEARNVAVLVPGMNRTLENLRDQSDWAHQIQTESGPDTATVLWVDYNSPQWLVAASKEPALEAVPALMRFRAGLDTETAPDTKLTMIGHSYGSQVIGQALFRGLETDRLIINGSPGIDRDVKTAADLVPPGTPVFTSRAPGDYVSYSEFHGADPATYPDAVRMKTDGGVSVRWHEQYYRTNSESLRNVGRVVRGDLAAVTTTDTSAAAETKLAAGVSWAGGLRSAAAAAGKAYDGLPPIPGVKPPPSGQVAGPDRSDRQPAAHRDESGRKPGAHREESGRRPGAHRAKPGAHRKGPSR